MKAVAIALALLYSQSFDAASVRLSDLNALGNRPDIRTSPGMVTITNMSIGNCIRWTYELPPLQIVGPPWMDNVRVDITAKAATPAGDPQLRQMMKTLLAERMGLRTHMENREQPVYSLTLAKGGPRFSESTIQGPPAFRKEKDVSIGERVGMSDFANLLSQIMGRPITDATGLKGRYDIRLDVSSYVAAAAASGNPIDAKDGVAILTELLPSQLGLKIESTRASVPMLIIDQLEKAPTPN